MEGWIKLHRRFTTWEWFNNSEMVHLFIYLLLKANHEDKKWKGIYIKRGQLITGIHSLSTNTNISIRSVRTCLKHLKMTNEIERQVTNKYSIITICNYESYQGLELISDKQSDKQTVTQATSKRQASDNKQEYKNNKEGKEEIHLPNKSVDFIDQIIDCFVQEYGDYKIITRGKERAAAGKILSLYKKQYPNDTSEETLQGLQIFFKQCVNITDDWLYENMNLSIIVSQYNKIIKILRNGKATGKQKGATPEEIANTVAKHFATDYRKRDDEYSEN